MIYDVMTIKDSIDLDLFLLRFEILKKYIDKFIVIELSKNNFLLYSNSIIYDEKIIYIPIICESPQNIIIESEEIFHIIKNFYIRDEDDIILSESNYIPYPDFLISLLSKEGCKIFSHIEFGRYFNSITMPYQKKSGSALLKYKDYYKYINNEIEKFTNFQDSGWCFNKFSESSSIYINNNIIKYIDDKSKFQKYFMPSSNCYSEIEGFFDYENLYDFAIDKFDNAKFIEIGSYYGKSLIYLASNIKIKQKNIQIDSIDIGVHPEGVQYYSEFIKNINNCFVADIIKYKKISSFYAHYLYPNEYADFIFIDADHSYEGLKKDIVNWWPKLKHGGILAGHDWWMDDVKNAVNEILVKQLGLKVQIDNVCWIVTK